MLDHVPSTAEASGVSTDTAREGEPTPRIADTSVSNQLLLTPLQPRPRLGDNLLGILMGYFFAVVTAVTMLFCVLALQNDATKNPPIPPPPFPPRVVGRGSCTHRLIVAIGTKASLKVLETLLLMFPPPLNFSELTWASAVNSFSRLRLEQPLPNTCSRISN